MNACANAERSHHNDTVSRSMRPPAGEEEECVYDTWYAVMDKWNTAAIYKWSIDVCMYVCMNLI